MIDFIRGGLADIWPDKTPEIQALSYAIQHAVQIIKEKADAARCYAAVDALPETILDYLAVELRSMYYEQDLEIEQKRAIIKNTLKWHMYAGTPPTVEEMVEIIFGMGQVVEWFDFTDPPYTPGTFDIVTSALLTEDVFQQLERLIKRVKNTRSHLRTVAIERQADLTFYAGAAVCCRYKPADIVEWGYQFDAEIQQDIYSGAPATTLYKAADIIELGYKLEGETKQEVHAGTISDIFYVPPAITEA